MRNSHKLRKEAEAKGIALMLSGSYVLQDLDSNEWDSVLKTNISKLKFSPEPTVVITNEDAKWRKNRGRLARFAFLSSDGRFAKYIDPDCQTRSSVISLRLINARSYELRAFLKRVNGGKTVHIERIVNPSEKWAGVLFGSLSDYYASLVVVTGKHPGFSFVDIETKSNRYNRSIRSRVLNRLPVGVSKRQMTFRKYGLD